MTTEKLTLEQVLEGVTAGGMWRFDRGQLVSGKNDAYAVGAYYNANRDIDLTYAARACSNFPALVKALEGCIWDMEQSERWKISTPAKIALRRAQESLAVALEP